MKDTRELVLLALTAVSCVCGYQDACCAASTPPMFVMVEGGKPVVSLVAGEQARPAAEFFAQEAAKCIGAAFDVKSNDDGGNRIVFDVQDRRFCEEDSYEIDFPDDRTMRITCTPVSARWAVNRILHDRFGVRWLFANPSEYGSEDELCEYPRRLAVGMPRKRVRQGAYDFWSLRAFDWRISGWNGHWDMKGHRPTHFMCVDVFPVYKYAVDQSWPDEILPILKGKKYCPPKAKGPLSDNPYTACKPYKYHWNPCFSNPKCAQIAISNVCEILSAHPDKKLVSLDINDIGGMCECDECVRLGCVESYYRWVNAVADGVTKGHPDVYFSLIAYREVLEPPSFPLHPNVLVRVCFEVSAMIDPDVRARRMKQMRIWGERARALEVYDYNYGVNWYLFPRIYFHAQATFMKELYETCHVRGYYAEAQATPFEGPKYALLSAILKNRNVDVDRFVRDWCVTAVGAKAAPSLEAYYRFWEDYCNGPEIRKTDWFGRSKFNIYLPGGRTSSAFALARGDMKRCRAFLEKALAATETTAQRARAELVMRFFELTEAAVEAVFAEEIPVDGELRSAEDALALLDRVKPARAAVERLRKNPMSKRFGALSEIDGEQCKNLALVVPFAKDARVRARLLQLAADETLPSALRGTLKVWAGESFVNEIQNGSFEEDSPMPGGWKGGRCVGKRTQDEASDGVYSIATQNPMLSFRFGVEPGKTYLVLFDVMVNKSSSEGNFNIRLTPSRADGSPRVHVGRYGLSLASGSWQTLSAVVTTGENAKGPDDHVILHLYGKNYEVGERVYVDNVRVVRID